jgi:glycosyltransferase involved in cell wall biosynthesis
MHLGPTVPGGIFLLVFLFGSLIRFMPQILKLRKHYKTRPKNSEPNIVIFSDNLDEINGIANNVRQVVSYLRSQGKNIRLVGTSFHTRKGEGVIETNGTVLLPQVYSMEQLGYKDSELAIPSIKEVLRFLKRYPVDLVEFETPSSASSLMLYICKIVGIPVISHYRTDVLGYSELLVRSPFMVWFIRQTTIFFCRNTCPVIVPCTDFKIKLQEDMGIKEQDIHIVSRGIPLDNFSPEKSGLGAWDAFFEPNPKSPKVRFLYVGRVSKEKELPFLENVWSQFRITHPEAELLITGSGPYLEEMKANCKGFSEVRFSGQLMGEDLHRIYADADYFLFPSGTDTFGNVVVEAMASGTPALVSDRGGPKDIIQHQCGVVISYKHKQKWQKTLAEACELKLQQPEKYQTMCNAAILRSKDYSLHSGSYALWNFILSQLERSAKHN